MATCSPVLPHVVKIATPAFVSQPTFLPTSSSPTEPPPVDPFAPLQCCHLTRSAFLKYQEKLTSIISVDPWDLANVTLVAPNGMWATKLNERGQLISSQGKSFTAIYFQSNDPVDDAQGPFDLVYEADNKLSIYNRTGGVVWRADSHVTTAYPGGCLAQQTDRNLVLYDGRCQVVWNSGKQDPLNGYNENVVITNTRMVGDPEGNGLSRTDFTKGPISKIQARLSWYGLTGLRLTHTNGEVSDLGDAAGRADHDFEDANIFQFTSNEQITEMAIFDNTNSKGQAGGGHQRCCGLWIKVRDATANSEREWKAICPHNNGADTQQNRIEVGGGFIVGFEYADKSDDILALRVLPIQKFSEMKVENVVYYKDEITDASIPGPAGYGTVVDVTYLPIQILDNTGSAITQSQEITVTTAKTNTYSHTVTEGYTYGFSLSISGGVPVVEGEAEFTFQYSRETDNGYTLEESTEIQNTFPLVCPPGCVCRMVSNVRYFPVSVKFTAAATVSIGGQGATYSYKIGGIFKGELVNHGSGKPETNVTMSPGCHLESEK